jgi:hypothetical protein
MDAAGNRRIQFNDPRSPGRRASVWLGRVPKKTAASFLANLEALIAAIRLNTSPTPEVCAWLGDLPGSTHEKLVAVGLADPRTALKVITLDELLTAFVNRATVKASAKAAYNQTTSSLRAVLGGHTPLADISPEHGDIWKKRISEDGLSPATVAKRVFVARAIFRKAVKWKMLASNPFADLPAGSQQNPERSFYVSPEMTTAVLDRCPGTFWKLVFALGRYAGLRIPSEIAQLTWDDVAWDTAG